SRNPLKNNDQTRENRQGNTTNSIPPPTRMKPPCNSRDQQTDQNKWSRHQNDKVVRIQVQPMFNQHKQRKRLPYQQNQQPTTIRRTSQTKSISPLCIGVRQEKFLCRSKGRTCPDPRLSVSVRHSISLGTREQNQQKCKNRCNNNQIFHNRH